MRARWLAAALVWLGLLGSLSPASAQRLAASPSANTMTAPSGLEAERHRWLETHLCALQRPARVYSYTWLSGLTALLVVQTTLVLTTDTSDEAGRAARTGYLLGASMTGIGLGLVGLTSRPETNSCDVMRSLPYDTPEARTARLKEGEGRLRRSARAARNQTSWWMHGLGVLLGTGVGLALGLGYSDNALRATVQGVGTFAFTELRIWTRPTRAIEYAGRYEQLSVP